MIPFDRHWLLTWTCYGQWLAGDARGFVGPIIDEHGGRVVHNVPGTPYDADIPPLHRWMAGRMKGPPIALDAADASLLISQFQDTARRKSWRLEAASAMFNHIHLVVGLPGDPEPEQVEATFKSWGTRALLARHPRPSNGSFWTAKGSTRKLTGDVAICDAVVYVVRKQPNPLDIWSDPAWDDALRAYDEMKASEK